MTTRCWNMCILTVLFNYMIVGKTDSPNQYFITIVDSNNRVIDVGFSDNSDLVSIAMQAVDDANLEGGEGCKSRECVAGLLVSAMRGKMEPNVSFDVYEKAKVVYGSEFTFYERQQEEEEEHNRNRGNGHISDGISDGIGVFADIPCIPPWCNFECSSELINLDKDLNLKSINAITDMLSKHDMHETDGECKKIPHTQSLADNMLKWPPIGRYCDGLSMIRPIWIAIPEERIVDCVPRKSLPFSSLIGSAYHFNSSQEHEYHRRYRNSYFGTTQKKSGWDCMRHLEILASGSVPWFTDFDGCTYPPEGVLAHLPIKLIAQYQNMLRSSGVVKPPLSTKKGSSNQKEASTSNGSIDFNEFNMKEYLKVAHTLLAFTKKRLSTKSLAEYILTTSGHSHLLSSSNQEDGMVLLLGSHGGEDYVKDMLIHGMRLLLGSRFIDYVRPRHLYREEHGTDISESKESLYGLGYTYAHSLPHSVDSTDTTTTTTTTTSVTYTTTTVRRRGSEHEEVVSYDTTTRTVVQEKGLEDINRSKLVILDNIVNRRYDLIIYGSIARGMPLLDEVLAAGYGSDHHLVFVDGEDENSDQNSDQDTGGQWTKNHTWLATMGQLYVREMPSGCPP